MRFPMLFFYSLFNLKRRVSIKGDRVATEYVSRNRSIERDANFARVYNDDAAATPCIIANNYRAVVVDRQSAPLTVTSAGTAARSGNRC